MVRRKIIKIDSSLCNGCGNCVTACSEGAIEMINGKAHVVGERFCDGLGACIGECPVGALKIEEREAEEFDEDATKTHLRQSGPGKSKLISGKSGQEHRPATQCSISFNKSAGSGPAHHISKLGSSSQLSSWPIQMRLAHAEAPYFKDSRLLIAADCSAFACPSISDFIKGKKVLIGCPKLDETKPFVNKLAEILRTNDVKDITVLHMEVPCCSLLVRLVMDAARVSGKDIPLEEFICMIDGDVSSKEKGSVKN